MQSTGNRSTHSWLSDDLIVAVRTLYEPRYGRSLLDAEVVDIAENLSGVVETLLKWKENVYGSTRV